MDHGINVAAILKQEGISDGPSPATGERESKEVRRILWKIDLRLLPILTAIYAFAIIDRVNLPNVSNLGRF